MVKKMLLAFQLAIMSPAIMNAQGKLSLENIKSVSFRNSGTIKESEELKGYYFFYVSDKIDKNTNEYTIQILDENLNTVKKITFQDDKDEQLVETSYNSSSLLFLFFNKKEKTFSSKIYGLDGKLNQTYVKDLDKRSINFVTSTVSTKLNQDEGQNDFIFNLENKGYLSIIPLRDGRDYSFEINIFHSDKKKQFTYMPDGEEFKWATASFLGSTDSLAIFEVMKKQKLMSNKMESSLLAIDINTGKKSFELPESATKFKFLPLNISTLRSTGEIVVMGSYYDKDDRVVKDASLGLATIMLNSKGQILAQKYNGWQDDFSKYFNIDSKGKLEDIGYLYFHKLIQTDNGDIYAIGEGYKRVVSGTGVALTALAALGGVYSGANSVTRLNITDMVVINFSSRFDLKNAVVYQKNKNRFELPGADYLTPHTLAATAKTLGAYDYEFTQVDNGYTNFSVGYTDYERGKDFKGLMFKSISYKDGKLTEDKLPLKTNASSIRIMPAKTGHILVSEYFKKQKRVDLRLEKMN